jgi:hypothetical protein
MFSERTTSEHPSDFNTERNQNIEQTGTRHSSQQIKYTCLRPND